VDARTASLELARSLLLPLLEVAEVAANGSELPPDPHRAETALGERLGGAVRGSVVADEEARSRQIHLPASQRWRLFAVVGEVQGSGISTFRAPCVAVE